MRILNHEQRSEEWFAARLGCPSGSGFSKLIRADGKPSSSADTYINELIAQKVTGEIPETYENEWMIRGRELEPDAKAFFEFERGVSVTDVGFIKHAEYEAGISPDGLVNADGAIEIKCPAPSTHIKYLRDGKLPSIYKPQVMGYMWVMPKVQWVDFLSYHPSLPPFLIRIERDKEYIELLGEQVIKACRIIETEAKKIEAMK